MIRPFAFFVAGLLLAPAASGAQTGPSVDPGFDGPEVLLYLAGDGSAAVDGLRGHARLIDVLAPQAYGVGADGIVRGGVSPELLAVAEEAGARLVPLIHNPGFDQAAIHGLLHDAAARRRTVARLVVLAERNGFSGWQFDFENIASDDADAYTRFYREAAEALRARGLELSVAVVPRRAAAPATAFGRYMRRNWRGSFELEALADAGDFISYMTYAQHGATTTPGPVASLAWMEETLEWALGRGVSAADVSLGLPLYSGYWHTHHDDRRGARVAGREVSFGRARALLDAAGVEPVWVPAHGVSYGFWVRDGVFEWVFLEDHRSLAAKLELFDRYPGLRGVSIWVAGAEDPGVWAVLEEWKARHAGNR